MDSSWPSGFRLLVDRFTVDVTPRRVDQPLFPDDLGRALASAELTLTPVSRPGGAIVVRVKDRVVDRLCLTVWVDDATPAPMTVTLEAQEDFLDAAIHVADTIIGHCRVLSRSPWLRGVSREFRLEDQKLYMMDPYTLSWFAGPDLSSPSPLAVYSDGANGMFSTGALRGPETGIVGFEAFTAAVSSLGPEPETSAALLVTAEERLTQMLLREAVVSLASAVEVASDAFIERHGGAARVKNLLRGSETFATKRLHLLTKQLLGISLREIDPPTFDLVEAAYRTRNSVSHRGQLTYMNPSGVTTAVGRHHVGSFLTAAREAVSWLDSI